MKSYTNLEQSKKLAEILPIESADMKWCFWKNEIDAPKTPTFGYSKTAAESYKDTEAIYLPCWSLAALRNLLPPAIKPNKDSYLFESHNTFDNSWVYRYYNEDGVSYLYYKDISEVDACFKMIIKLKENRLI